MELESVFVPAEAAAGVTKRSLWRNHGPLPVVSTSAVEAATAPVGADPVAGVYNRLKWQR